jgi:endonuclease YncB( thermonuclease family)
MKYLNALSIFLLTFLLSHSGSAEENLIITKVIDVNTIEINNQNKIKLYGVSNNIYKEYQNFKERYDMRSYDVNYNSVGELEQYTITGNTYDEEDAIKEMQKILLNKNVLIEEVQHKKYLVLFSEKDDYSVNQLIISKGFASVDESINSNYRIKFLLEEKNAKENNLGIWNISFKSVSSGSSETILPNMLYLILSGVIFFNMIILIFSIKKLSSLPSWRGLLYGLFSLITIPIPAVIISLQYELIAKIYLLLIFVITIFIFYYLTKFILKYKEILTIQKLILLVIGAVIIVIFYFSNVYNVFDKPRSINLVEQGFSKNHIISQNEIFTGDYLYVNNQSEPFNDYYIYFSGTTFFGGSYGDVVPKGNIRYIVLIEMFTSFILQLVFFGIIFNVVYEKFNNNRFKQATSKDVVKQDSSNLEKEQKSLQKSDATPEKNVLTEKKTNQNFSLLFLVKIIILILLFKKKK